MHQRLMTLFKLLNENDTHIPCKVLSSKLKVSERTIRTDISSINSILEKNGAIIKMKKGEGYYINILDLTLFQQYLITISEEIMETSEIPDSPIERIKYIIKLLLYNNNYIKVEDLADQFYVSRVTILNDIKRIKPILSKYNLTLVSKPYYGLKVQGKEIDIRKCISSNIINRNFDNYIIGITKEELELFKDIDLKDLQDFILKEISIANIDFSDFNLKNFIIHLAITTTRILKGYNIINNQDIAFTNFNSNTTIDNIYNYLEDKYNISISKPDKIYIYNHFFSKSTPSEDSLDNKINDYVKDLLEIVNSHYNFDLRDDIILINDLVHHFKSILNAKYYNLNKINPLINMIKSNYPLAFEISLTSIEIVFKKTMYTLTEDEVGYVSLHIGAAIERLFQNNVKRKNVIIVCGSGYGSSRLLEVQLNKIFHEKINIIKCLSFSQFNKEPLQNIDLIISTIPLQCDNIEVVLVSLSLLKKDIENITKVIAQDSFINKNEIFDKNLFIYHPQINNKDDLINLMCNTLYKNKIVEKNFSESVFTRENLSSTDIDDFLAIPHPMDLTANKTSICISILKEPIYWNDTSTISIVFLLAINKNDLNKMDSIYELILEIINNNNLRSNLCNCTSFNSFINIVNSLN